MVTVYEITDPGRFPRTQPPCRLRAQLGMNAYLYENFSSRGDEYEANGHLEFGAAYW
jgi:hypothetical protein